MKKSIFLVLFLFLYSILFSQSVTQIEYFYDNDPGFGNANQLSFSQSGSVDLNTNLDISNVSPGVHSVFVRAKDNNGNWSLYNKKQIFIIAGHEALPNVTDIEFYWDIDPGLGLGTEISITAGDDVNVNIVVDLEFLTPGIHSLYIRAKDGYDNWSLYSKKQIFIIAGHEALPNVTDLEFYWDIDPGLGMGAEIPITEGDDVTVNIGIDLEFLAPGIHSLYIRAKDGYDNWSLYTKRNVFVIEGHEAVPYIVEMEYFWDVDPGLGQASEIAISSAPVIQQNFILDISNLSAGVHSLYVRTRDMYNNWSLYTKKNIFVIEGYQVTPLITNIEYFWDTDPGLGQATPVNISADTEIDQNFVINIANMNAGIHSLYIRSKDMYNNWSLYTKKNIFIIKGSTTLPDVTELEYFFDIDPGFGAGTSLPMTASNTIDENYVIPLTNLVDGDHELYIRARDSYGKWSLYSQNTVHIGDWGCVYTDVDVSHIAYTAVQDLCARGLLDNDGKCEPDDYIQRDALAKLVYLSIELQNNPTADIFPSPFNDLRNLEDTWYYSYAKNLAYLEFDDHKSPFDRNFFNFNPSNPISKAHTLKVLLEAFNIDETNNTGSVPFLDDNLATHEAYAYIVKAYDLGIIDDTFDHLFKPNDNIYRREVFEIIHRMLTVLSLPIPTITNDDFFEPGNYTPENFASFAGLHSGNFNHYTKTSFAIASVGIPLSFEHTYNSYLSEMPKELIPLQPLGKMWNHTYNSYLKEIPGDVTRPNDFRVLVALPNSGFHVYKKNGGNYTCETKGVYNTLTKPTSDKFQITTKNQIVYTYQKLGGTSNDYPFVLVSIHDRNGNTMSINYENSADANHSYHKRIKEVVGTAGRKLQFFYHPNTNLVNYIQDPLNRKVYYTYGSDGKLVTFKDAKNQLTHYNYGTTYAEEDLLMSIQLPKGNVVTNTYQGKKLMSSQTNGNNPTTYNYVRNYGQTATNNFTKTTVTNPNNQTSIIDYNKNGNPNHIVKDNNTTVDITYNTTQETKPSNITINGKSAGMTYDNMGNVLTVNLPLGVSYHYSYNSNNDITQYTDPNGHNYNYSYNGNGNLTQTTTPRGSTSFSVNTKGLVTSVTNPESITTSYSYDAYGNLTQTNAPEGISTSSSYDVVSRLLSFTNPNGVSTTYQYDANDNMLQETINSHTTSYAFDPNDNLTQITNANGGATTMVYDFDNDFLTSVNFGNAHDNYTYYDDGKVHTYNNPNGNTFTYTYDTQGRLTTVSTSGSTVSYTYDNHNNILTTTNNNGTITYTYDALNRITSTADYFGNTVAYTYDANSNVTKITYPGNKEVNYTYHNDNLLASVTDWNNQTTTYLYRDDGLLSSINYPNGTHCDYTYDGAGRQTVMSWRKADNTVINEYAHTLDAMGNHLSETKTEPFTVSILTNDNINYTYNNTNKLQTANGTNNVSFGYDTNGNTTTKTGNTYTYDKYDNLTGITGSINAQYQYDANGNRRKSTINGTEKRYVLDVLGMCKVLIETNNSNTAQNYYIYGLGLISRIDANNTTNYYHYDFRGSTIAMTDATETITHKYEYNDFGQTLQIDETDFNAYRYVGKYGVAYEDTELYFMRARYYDPSVGRFLSEDPIWSTNLYPYADNNPVTMIDPKGENAAEILNLTKAVAENIPSYAQVTHKIAPAVSSTIAATKIALNNLISTMEIAATMNEVVVATGGVSGSSTAVATYTVNAAISSSAASTSSYVVSGTLGSNVATFTTVGSSGLMATMGTAVGAASAATVGAVVVGGLATGVGIGYLARKPAARFGSWVYSMTH